MIQRRHMEKKKKRSFLLKRLTNLCFLFCDNKLHDLSVIFHGLCISRVHMVTMGLLDLFPSAGNLTLHLLLLTILLATLA